MAVQGIGPFTNPVLDTNSTLMHKELQKEHVQIAPQRARIINLTTKAPESYVFLQNSAVSLICEVYKSVHLPGLSQSST